MSNTITYEVGAEALQHALKANYDAESAYEQLLEKSNNEVIHSYLVEKIEILNSFSLTITKMLLGMGLLPIEKGTVVGGISRLWFDLKSVILDYNPQIILEESKKIDKDHHYTYLTIVRSGLHSENVYETLMNQLSEIQSIKRPQLMSNEAVIQSVQLKA